MNHDVVPPDDAKRGGAQMCDTKVQWAALLAGLTVLGSVGRALGAEPGATGRSDPSWEAAAVVVGTFHCYVSGIRPSDGTGISNAAASLSFFRDPDVASAHAETGPSVDVFLGSGEGLEGTCQRFAEQVSSLAQARGCWTGPIQTFDVAAGNATEKHWSFTIVCTDSDPGIEGTLRALIADATASPLVRDAIQQPAGQPAGMNGSPWSQGTGNGDPCPGLFRRYAMAFEFASRCDASLSEETCTAVALYSIPCGCPTWVNASNARWVARLSALESQWRSSSCQFYYSCGGSACSGPPLRGECVSIETSGPRPLARCVGRY